MIGYKLGTRSYYYNPQITQQNENAHLALKEGNFEQKSVKLEICNYTRKEQNQSSHRPFSPPRVSSLRFY